MKEIKRFDMSMPPRKTKWYLKPIKKYAKAVATIIKQGKTITLYKADIFNEKDELCATVTMNYYNMK